MIKKKRYKNIYTEVNKYKHEDYARAIYKIIFTKEEPSRD